MKNLIVLFLLSICLSIQAQEAIDGGFDFQTESNKSYALYIPSSYDENIPNTLMLGLHPLNPSRWNATSWRDTLINFAESNSLILVCPDGGVDGRIDDPIDTAFTTVLLDSVYNWYNIDHSQKYIMGFSWGGKTTYSYGLNRTNEFAGYMPIGAAINGSSEFNAILPNANGEPFYIIHGSEDAPSTRLSPMIFALETFGACLETNVLQDVGHTIDFPNRNEILSTAFQWLVDQSCGTSSVEEIEEKDVFYPNPIAQGNVLFIKQNRDILRIEIYENNGRLLKLVNGIDNSIDTSDLKGMYLLRVIDKHGDFTNHKLVVY